MVRSTTTTTDQLAESFGIGPREYFDYAIENPVLVISHNFTYFAPEEMTAIPLNRPTIITFGAIPADHPQTQLPHTHLLFPCDVQDRLDGNTERTVAKHVDVADMHGAIIYRDNMLFYKHLGDRPTVLAERIMGSRIITTPGAVVPVSRVQTIGFGASSDAFGGRLWWYYFRITSQNQSRQTSLTQ